MIDSKLRCECWLPRSARTIREASGISVGRKLTQAAKEPKVGYKRGTALSNRLQGTAGSSILSIIMLLGVGSCGGSSNTSDPTASADKNNLVDAPFLEGNPGLQAAHAKTDSGDGFRTLISTHYPGCSEAIWAMRISRHQYKVICSAEQPVGVLTYHKFVIDTDTGDSVALDERKPHKSRRQRHRLTSKTMAIR